MVRYMIIERMRAGHSRAVYDRFFKKGRLLPDGLFFLDSWLSADDTTIYQIMETADVSLFDTWCANWDDLVDFEIIELKEKPTGELQDDH